MCKEGKKGDERKCVIQKKEKRGGKRRMNA